MGCTLVPVVETCSSQAHLLVLQHYGHGNTLRTPDSPSPRSKHHPVVTRASNTHTRQIDQPNPTCPTKFSTHDGWGDHCQKNIYNSVRLVNPWCTTKSETIVTLPPAESTNGPCRSDSECPSPPAMYVLAGSQNKGC